MPLYMVTRFVLKVNVMSFILKCKQYQKSQFVMADPVEKRVGERLRAQR